ncbi:hypothetical protein TRIUR3_20960 [Triticum urartu]|uniref:Uncharacterized protein n=1 Tax=Triticum urartu TaxID=4572 RepID=M7ZK37_TRIUA|nr:hypothetical protein TRIUR3_20960 [Triticum urartu]
MDDILLEEKMKELGWMLICWNSRLKAAGAKTEFAPYNRQSLTIEFRLGIRFLLSTIALLSLFFRKMSQFTHCFVNFNFQTEDQIGRSPEYTVERKLGKGGPLYRRGWKEAAAGGGADPILPSTVTYGNKPWQPAVRIQSSAWQLCAAPSAGASLHMYIVSSVSSSLPSARTGAADPWLTSSGGVCQESPAAACYIISSRLKAAGAKTEFAPYNRQSLTIEFRLGIRFLLSTIALLSLFFRKMSQFTHCFVNFNFQTEDQIGRSPEYTVERKLGKGGLDHVFASRHLAGATG